MKDVPYEFWKEYDEADYLDKEKKLKPIIKNMLSVLEIDDKEIIERMLLLSLRGYFDDILEYCYNRNNR